MKNKKPKSTLPASGLGLLATFFLLSWLIHSLSLFSLSQWDSSKNKDLAKKPSKPIHIKVLSKEQSAANLKQLVEVMQEKTEKKPDPTKVRAGQVDHHTLKETKVAQMPPRKKALDPGQAQSRPTAQKPTLAEKKTATQEKTAAQESKSSPFQAVTPIKKGGVAILSSKAKDPVALLPKRRAARNRYEQLLNQSIATMGKQVEQGYQDYLNDDIELGTTIDLNTQEYRYIGYFTSLRKAIELTWNYPSTALHRGIDGNVFLRFTIAADGKVTRVMVLNSSGHYVLDHAVVDAIQLAAPFAPLPQEFGKKIDIKGTFRYILN